MDDAFGDRLHVIYVDTTDYTLPDIYFYLFQLYLFCILCIESKFLRFYQSEVILEGSNSIVKYKRKRSLISCYNRHIILIIISQTSRNGHQQHLKANQHTSIEDTIAWPSKDGASWLKQDNICSSNIIIQILCQKVKKIVTFMVKNFKRAEQGARGLFKA